VDNADVEAGCKPKLPFQIWLVDWNVVQRSAKTVDPG